MGLTIQNPDVGRALQELFRLQGRVRPELDSFVIPTVTVGDVSGASTPPVIRSAVSFSSIAAVAAEFPGILLNVPGGVCCQVHSVRFRSTTATDLAVNVANASIDSLTVAARAFLDGRINRLQNPVVTMLSGTQAGAIPAFEYRIDVPASEEIVWKPHSLILGLGPGATNVDQLEFQFGTVNIVITNFSIEWTEYPSV